MRNDYTPEEQQPGKEESLRRPIEGTETRYTMSFSLAFVSASQPCPLNGRVGRRSGYFGMRRSVLGHTGHGKSRGFPVTHSPGQTCFKTRFRFSAVGSQPPAPLVVIPALISRHSFTTFKLSLTVRRSHSNNNAIRSNTTCATFTAPWSPLAPTRLPSFDPGIAHSPPAHYIWRPLSKPSSTVLQSIKILLDSPCRGHSAQDGLRLLRLDLQTIRAAVVLPTRP